MTGCIEELEGFLSNGPMTEAYEAYHYVVVKGLTQKQAANESGLRPRVVSTWSKIFDAILRDKKIKASSREVDRLRSKAETIFENFVGMSEETKKELRRRIYENIVTE